MTYITYEQFERDYAKRSNLTVEELHAHGLYPKFCNCGEEGCHGWAMAQAVYPCGRGCGNLTNVKGDVCAVCYFALEEA